MTDIFYTKDHEWIKVNGDEGVVGITSYASEQLGDIVFVELPEKGNSFDQGKDVAVIESVKAASEIYSPASGEIFETNSSLEEKPEIINEDPLDIPLSARPNQSPELPLNYGHISFSHCKDMLIGLDRMKRTKLVKIVAYSNLYHF